MQFGFVKRLLMSPAMETLPAIRTEHLVVRQVLTVGHAAYQHAAGDQHSPDFFQACFHRFRREVFEDLSADHGVNTL